jgi:hypothetical protein
LAYYKNWGQNNFSKKIKFFIINFMTWDINYFNIKKGNSI